MIKKLKSRLRLLIDSHRLNKDFKTYEFLQEVDLEHLVENKCIKNIKKIAFIIPGMTAYSGGRTSILRLGTYLVEFGYDIYYITFDESTVKTMKINAEINLHSYKGTIMDKSALTNILFDIGIGTSWQSCYYLYKYQEQFSYKMYFVQDYEPAFYAESDLYYLARNTYKMGLHIVSLGRWNADRIQQSMRSAKVDYIDFPFEKFQYLIKKKQVKIKDRISLCVYIKLDQKRGSILLFQALDLLKKIISQRDFELEIKIFGLDPHIQVPVGVNLGQLNHQQLIRLYEESDLGIVASYSNVSLVPYEMIACGLPVIEVRDGSAPTFFDDNSMIFAETYPKSFVRKIMYYIDHPNELQGIIDAGQDEIEKITWEKSARQMAIIIEKIKDAY